MSSLAFVGVDWGTSSFRAWSFDQKGNVVGQDKTDLGLSKLGQGDFAPTLKASLERLTIEESLPVLACGMVGAAQGWREAPYAETGEDLRTLPRQAIQPQQNVWILPGVKQASKTAPDVMRGEETLVLGLLQQGLEDATLCTPGTHSKWIALEAGRIKKFRTFMTGEVFGLMKSQSILSAFTSEALVDPQSEAFTLGVEESLARPENLISALFSCRSTPLVFGQVAAADMASRLSGLMVGAEIAGAKAAGLAHQRPVQLLADTKLGPIYESAFTQAGLTFQNQDSESLAQKGLLLAARQLWPNRFEGPPT